MIKTKVRLVIASKYEKRMDLGRGIEWASNVYYIYFLPCIDWKLLKPGQYRLPISPQHPGLCWGLRGNQVLKSLLSESVNHHFIWSLLGGLPPRHCLYTSCLFTVPCSCITTNTNVCILSREFKWLETPGINWHNDRSEKGSLSKKERSWRWPKMQWYPSPKKEWLPGPWRYL